MIAKAIEPGSRKSTGRPASTGRIDDRAEEEQHDDRQDGGRDEGLAAAEGEPQLHRRHRQRSPRQAARRHAVAAEAASRLRPRAVAADQLEVALLERSAARPQLDDRARRAPRTTRRAPRRAAASARPRRADSAPPPSSTSARAAAAPTRASSVADRPRTAAPSSRNRRTGDAPRPSSAGRPERDEPAAVDDRDPVGDPLDVGQVVARQQDRDALVAQPADQRRASPPAPRRPSRPSARRGRRAPACPTSASASPSRCRSPPDSRR